MHNIPRRRSRSAGGTDEQSKALQLHGLYCWKPQPSEQALLQILRNLLKDPTADLLTFAPEFNIYERFVVHMVADMLDLEHQSFDMDDGELEAVKELNVTS